MVVLFRRLFAILRILWLRWRNPPPTLEQIQKEHEARLAQIEQEHRKELAEFDAVLKPLVVAMRYRIQWENNLMAAKQTIERRAPLSFVIPDQAYCDYWADHVRVYADGTRAPIPGDRWNQY